MTANTYGPAFDPGGAGMKINFTVYAVAQPQGSARAFIPKGWKRPIITSDNAKLKPFRQEVAQMARCAMLESEAQMAERGTPVVLTLKFFFEKPQSARKAAQWKTTKPDLDKLARAVLDALTGIVYSDDSQVCQLALTKRFGSPARVEIQVSTAVDGVPKSLFPHPCQVIDSAQPVLGM